MEEHLYLTKKTCAVCRKTMWIDTEFYRYRIPKGLPELQNYKYFCSYSCYRVVDRKKREKAAKIAERQMREAANCDLAGNPIVKKKRGRPRKDAKEA